MLVCVCMEKVRVEQYTLENMKSAHKRQLEELEVTREDLARLKEASEHTDTLHSTQVW